MHTRFPRAGLTRWDVVGLLAALLVFVTIFGPTCQPRVRENPRRASCQSNMKQLGLAFVQYEQDQDGQTPPGLNRAGNGWAGQVYSYVKSTGVYHCPDDHQDGSYVSYANNRNTVRQTLTKFADPAETVQLYEMTTLNCDPATTETVSATGWNAPQNDPRHNDQNFGLNFLAVDAHAKYLKPTAVSSGPYALRPKQGGTFAMTFAIK